ncbi:2-amino-4-hydroxy-6-hydroxymethyldihydropteridine diphosphokinase [Flavobacterium azooxidireducens]|uniref:2-amino-4-hydroxy-6-hydroxymethyldihydropteridine pyrophosphokinase n=1 Tax=Flavobacterium azooxidireducens TaxID=1871076 RepID=A0ABY4KKX6_9FLAO|nr:2-amino-4-hydroxy-6-hydroxymethyldihydropteridine diphosphokinase [Flavobacterium azooxidireducens]UPQ80050.1 2-amino-4-hydroxy-6-hydroxymethyldihydropteridine diphosphokinase [Flavobacterium azooxidireducens]
MNNQSQVILSLGSNLGNRLENIQLAIISIHKTIATVVKVSSLYETPSWGFDSEPFYNCALVLQTSKGAEQILDEVLQLETKLGRVRNNEEGYLPRIIDIDVITYNEEIINTERLKVPHPHMQNRKFVLLPMRDLNLDWRHPILQKYLPELVALAEDKSNCKVVQKLEAPLEKINLQQFNYIAIEGNIGAGKTTLSSKIAEDFNAKLVLERFADNPFLPKFYEDQSRYAFPLEMSFLADRYQQLSDDLAQFDLFKDFIVADYHIFKSLIFAKVTLAEDEFRLYKTMFDIIHKEMPKPDLYVYLYQNTDQLLENIKKRGRSYEMQIPAEYLEKINQGYLDFIKTQTNLNVLIIDVSDKDFVNNQEDYVFILDQIQAKLH